MAWNAGWMAPEVVGLGTSVRQTSRPFHVKLCGATRRAVALRRECVCPARGHRREQARQDTRTGWRWQATQIRVRCRPRRGSAWSYFETIDHAMQRLVGRGAKPRSVHSQARLAPRTEDPGSPAEREHPRASLATSARSDVAKQRNSARSHSVTRVLVKPCAAGCGLRDEASRVFLSHQAGAGDPASVPARARRMEAPSQRRAHRTSRQHSLERSFHVKRRASDRGTEAPAGPMPDTPESGTRGGGPDQDAGYRQARAISQRPSSVRSPPPQAFSPPGRGPPFHVKRRAADHGA